MHDIEVFYHIYVPIEYPWTVGWWIDKQLGAIKTSGLSDVAKTKITLVCSKEIVGPLKFNPEDLSHAPSGCVSIQEDVISYINQRYPFAEVIDTRTHSEKKLFEGQCLDQLWNSAVNTPQKYYLYIHSKGTSSCSLNQIAWVDVLTYNLTERWRECIDLLDHGADVVAVKDEEVFDKVFSGNFFWATGKYLSRLPKPTVLGEECFQLSGIEGAFRHAFERWGLSGVPNRKNIAEIPHPRTFLFLTR